MMGMSNISLLFEPPPEFGLKINMISMLLGISLIVLTIIVVWYFISTIIIINKRSTLTAILAFLFSPFGHIFFYQSSKVELTLEEKRKFIRFFIVYLLMIMAVIISILNMD